MMELDFYEFPPEPKGSVLKGGVPIYISFSHVDPFVFKNP